MQKVEIDIRFGSELSAVSLGPHCREKVAEYLIKSFKNLLTCKTSSGAGGMAQVVAQDPRFSSQYFFLFF
jgi:hypothetical protein